jgi:tetratricopeptide (TPR) repeat protein
MKHVAALFILFICKAAFSQDLVDRYYDFGGAVTEGRQSTAVMLAETILPEISSLSEKRQAIFYFKLAGLHENMKNTDQAILFYERTLKLEPDYYVPHMALGYLYISKANSVLPTLNAEQDKLARDRYMREYYSLMRKAIPFLEKAMACDPNEQVLASIKNCYDSVQDTAGLSNLDARLKSLAQNCVTVLKEE